VRVLVAGVGYDGAMNSAGQPHGKGVGYDTHGNQYAGDWVEGKKNGKGAMVYSDGGKYEGEWVNDAIEGDGKYTWADDGGVYDGHFEKGKRDGNGTMVYENGYKYAGEWKDDFANGEGCLFDPKGTVFFKGRWIKGVCSIEINKIIVACLCVNDCIYVCAYVCIYICICTYFIYIKVCAFVMFVFVHVVKVYDESVSIFYTYIQKYMCMGVYGCVLERM
jgi:hypothetical protein